MAPHGVILEPWTLKAERITSLRYAGPSQVGRPSLNAETPHPWSRRSRRLCDAGHEHRQRDRKAHRRTPARADTALEAQDSSDAPSTSWPTSTGLAAATDPGAILNERLQLAMSNETSVVHSDPEILGGTPVFVGTRVPVKSLYDYLEAGDSLDEFLESFPSVSREQAVAALELARTMTEAPATAAR